MAERLKIAFITERFGRQFGGAEAYAVNLCEVLSRQHDVTIIASEFDHSLPVNEILVKRLKGWPSWIRALHFALKTKKLSYGDFDVVHTHVMGTLGDVHVVHVVPVRFRRFFMQNRWRGWLSYLQPRNIAYLWLEANSLRESSKRIVVAVSPSVKAQISSAYPELNRVEMITPGARMASADATVRSSLRKHLGLDEEDVVCLLVARDPLLKGFAAVLQALALLPENYKLLVVGADHLSRNYLLSYHPSLKGRVNLLEPTSDVSPYYRSADVCVHPTLLDSFGMAPLEAMAHGLPVVLSASQYCGFAAFVRHKHDAWVLDDPKDVTEIAEAIFSLGENPDLRETITRQSRSLVQAFTWESIAQRYEVLYDQIVSFRKGPQSQPRSQ